MLSLTFAAKLMKPASDAFTVLAHSSALAAPCTISRFSGNFARSAADESLGRITDKRTNSTKIMYIGSTVALFGDVKNPVSKSVILSIWKQRKTSKAPAKPPHIAATPLPSTAGFFLSFFSVFDVFDSVFSSVDMLNSPFAAAYILTAFFVDFFAAKPPKFYNSPSSAPTRDKNPVFILPFVQLNVCRHL